MEIIILENGQKMQKIIVGNTEILTPVIENIEPPVIINEPVDEEKVAMAEAIIDMDTRITELENKLNGGI